jgi:lysophospholipase L1-like esterase
MDTIKTDRFENEIENFRRFDCRNTLSRNPVLFVGSSSIVYWETARAFPEFPVINRGFGGAGLSDLIHYYNDIIKKHSPAILVVYSDIDIESGKSPDEAVNAFKVLVNMVREDFPDIPVLILSIKPALVDNFIGKDIRNNKLITNWLLAGLCNEDKNLHYVDVASTMLKHDGNLRKDIFLPDGMHMNSSGYELWNPVIREKIESLKKPVT